MPTDITWRLCSLCGGLTPHKHIKGDLYRCMAASHDKTVKALEQIERGEDLKKKPKCKDEE